MSAPGFTVGKGVNQYSPTQQILVKEMRTIRLGRLVYKVHRNLREALRYLRHADRPRTFWIDALCINQPDINQLDTEERNHQIGQMSMVYSRASKVVA
ncbi:hypothetical protein PZA11_006657 [Diplocarpon coronariae]